MVVRVTLLTAAATAAVRAARFDPGEGLDEPGRAAARAAADRVPRGGRTVLTAPSARCRETCAELGLGPGPRIEPAVADWDLGRWRGRGLDETARTEPDAMADWLGDPASAPHGGESLLDLRARVGGWLDGLAHGPAGRRVLAVAEAAVVRVAVLHALALPPETFWRLDVPPLSRTDLSGDGRRWNLRLGTRLEGRDAGP
ncbi:histidine phosphatase family protein [Streptomyces sp. NPDC006798]|uniref:histidine phosphatase family protein n=1 Tax=Streptomyces sp. NPDC006798 TaxID=3155462 RepID=UPI0033FB7802